MKNIKNKFINSYSAQHLVSWKYREETKKIIFEQHYMYMRWNIIMQLHESVFIRNLWS